MKIILYTDYLISQKYKKYSPAKYAKLLYQASSKRWISIMFDFVKFFFKREKDYTAN